MKIKLQTKITLIYALIFTMVLLTINAAVFLIVRFYITSSDNLSLLQTRSIVETIIREKGTINQDDLIEQGIRFPMVVKVKYNDQEFSSIPNLTIYEENKTNYLKLDYLGEPKVFRAAVSNTEFIGPGQISYQLTFAKNIEDGFYNRRVTFVTTAIASFLGMLLSIAVGSYMSHESFKPISNMRKAVDSISADNLSNRILVPTTGDELTDLGNTFNSLLDRMETAYNRQSKFVSDASHELRTPLTVIKGYSDMLGRWGKTDPEILDEAIGAIKAETQNMNNLVENLLFIAKGENLKLNFVPERFNLLELVEEVSTETVMNVSDKKVEFGGESFEIVADRKMMKQMLRVFIENSVKFTSPGGVIQTTLYKVGNNGVIKIRDNGDGIAPEDIKRVFERFFVADKARTKDKSGSGLGLSIAKWIIDVHQGSVELASSVGEFTEFTVTLPLNTENSSAGLPVIKPQTVDDYERKIIGEKAAKSSRSTSSNQSAKKSFIRKRPKNT